MLGLLLALSLPAFPGTALSALLFGLLTSGALLGLFPAEALLLRQLQWLVPVLPMDVESVRRSFCGWQSCPHLFHHGFACSDVVRLQPCLLAGLLTPHIWGSRTPFEHALQHNAFLRSDGMGAREAPALSETFSPPGVLKDAVPPCPASKEPWR